MGKTIDYWIADFEMIVAAHVDSTVALMVNPAAIATATATAIATAAVTAAATATGFSPTTLSFRFLDSSHHVAVFEIQIQCLRQSCLSYPHSLL